MIRTDSLTKRFGRLCAVDGIDLDVREGDIYGFLGANGSGKTTTVRMLLGLVLPTGGAIELLGQPMPRAAQHVLREVGALIEGPAAYGHLSGRANLTLLDAAGPGGTAAMPSGRIHSARTRSARVREALDQVGLGAVGRRPVKQYSLGMRQRLGLAAALLRRPRLLILDEPTNGLDPQGIHEIRELLTALNRAGTTVFLSSHLLAEVEQLCTRIGVLDRGRLVLQDQLDQLSGPTGRTVVVTPDPATAAAAIGSALIVEACEDRLLVDDSDVTKLAEAVLRAGARLTEIAPERRTLEDVVLAAARTSGDARR